MKPNKSGWLGRYLQRLKASNIESHAFQKLFEPDGQGLDFEPSVYKLLQPTGLMYGYPLKNTGLIQAPLHRWEGKEKMKFILFDSIMHTSLMHHRHDIINPNDLEVITHDSARKLNNFYQHIYPELNVNNHHFFGSKKNDFRMAEDLLNARLYLNNKWQDNFWYRFFENSLLFLDVFYFSHFLTNESRYNDLFNKGLDPESMRLLILKIIAAAANADEYLAGEEKKLFHFFLHSAHLSPSGAKEATEFLTDIKSLDQISFENIDSWLLKKYILELAILTIWADKKVEPEERDLVQTLKIKLGLEEKDISSSMLALEGFVLDNWQHVHFLQDKHSFLKVKNRYQERVSRLIHHNSNAIRQEIYESKELWTLMHKAHKQGLSLEEKTKVRNQLLDILKCLPPFVIIALPGTFFTLPLMLKLLPPGAFPSSFKDEV